MRAADKAFLLSLKETTQTRSNTLRSCKHLYKILKHEEEKLKKHMQAIGLFNTKAKNILKACELFLDKCEGQAPDCRTSLESLQGVGRKTANVILDIAFKQEIMTVHTYIFRVSNRTGLTPSKSVLK